MDFRDLKYFAVIAEEGHVGRAAERLFKTQPALTKCIDRLEEQLGAPLFERVGRGIRLTPVGEALLHRARRISLMMDETAREIGDYAHGREGNIRLGCIPTLAEHILPGICQQLLAEAEKVTIDLKVSMNDALLEGLKAGELDVVLGPMIQDDELFHTEEIMRDEMVVMASPNHPIFDRKIRLRHLLEYQWVLPAQSVLSRQWLDNVFDRHHLSRPTVQITPTVLNMIMPLIERSNLLGFASKLNLLAGRNHLREVVLKETTMLRRMGLSYRRDTYLSPAALRLIKIIRGTTLD
ncbi:LysR family transcriptional regulator [Herbaspirillum huttiense F1]|jgi:DNA-binding transcriptional LysR family regulator|uniref:LysR family transcriptional regulator n=3 Tax=Herbaspirillum huttiense TaxID=863372 RepID=A0AAJ2LUF8_9BURK|nr:MULTISPECIES: LysR family transcriptional regulator [Herbaspirillum]MBP1317416.1 DNA-binding transcriptional LysR family regulator [Herbaspirillum sp. 1130]MCO4857651.1 LysR family transcriptional regulator [Herbaspirillum sp. WGmk3]MDR6741357.1 DNA-binding transcriptional LysR family regulator [Herbaspirillum sp. 1173]MDR9835906.1 LysR family transcriptional regulator [Herbaspirillum huttiense]MDR9849065.1 LysR family transcriptional regulator [Herbaspirillum huttiense SE1]